MEQEPMPLPALEDFCAWCGAAAPSHYPVTEDGLTAYCCCEEHQQQLIEALS